MAEIIRTAATVIGGSILAIVVVVGLLFLPGVLGI